MLSDVRLPTPEEEELGRKRAELNDLETEMVQREIDLATLLAELQAFERRYTRVVGVRIAEVDQIEAEIATLLAQRALHDQRLRRRLFDAHARARESASASASAEPDTPLEAFQPSTELKLLFRDLAKRIHPDLADGDGELPRRTRLMAEANAAYQRGDVACLAHILAEWQSAPETVRGEGPGAELVRTIRRIAQARRRLASVEEEMGGLTASEVFQLRAEVEQAGVEGYDLLAEMAVEIDDRASAAHNRLAALQRAEATDGTSISR